MSAAGTPVTDEAYVGLAGSGTAAASLVGGGGGGGGGGGRVLKGYGLSAFALC